MSLVWGIFGSALTAALVGGCGLSTEGGASFDVIEEPDAGVDERDAGESRDAGGGGAKDAGVDADASIGDADVDDDGGLDASTDAEPDADDDAGPDGSDDLDAAPPDDGDAPEPDGGSDSDAGDPDASDPDASDPGAGDSGAGDPDCVIGADPCDMDCDGVLAPSCGGDDCCDSDPDVFPGQTEFFETANECGDYDYNCDGDEQKRGGAGDVCERKAFSCEEKQGFVGFVPNCGDRGAWVRCTSWQAFGGCDSDFQERVQSCR